MVFTFQFATFAFPTTQALDVNFLQFNILKVSLLQFNFLEVNLMKFNRLQINFLQAINMCEYSSS